MRRALLVAAFTAVLALPVVAAARDGAEPPTWNREVGRIVLSKCAGCHTAGGIAPFALTSAGDARRHATRIAEVVAAGRMPPWMPGPESPAYVGQGQRQLTAA